jgi:hypothetical protein
MQGLNVSSCLHHLQGISRSFNSNDNKSGIKKNKNNKKNDVNNNENNMKEMQNNLKNTCRNAGIPFLIYIETNSHNNTNKSSNDVNNSYDSVNDIDLFFQVFIFLLFDCYVIVCNAFKGNFFFYF